MNSRKKTPKKKKKKLLRKAIKAALALYQVEKENRETLLALLHPKLHLYRAPQGKMRNSLRGRASQVKVFTPAQIKTFAQKRAQGRI